MPCVQVTDFVQRRLEQLLVDSGICIEAVRAVLPHRGRNPSLAATSARQLQVSYLSLSAADVSIDDGSLPVSSFWC